MLDRRAKTPPYANLIRGIIAPSSFLLRWGDGIIRFQRWDSMNLDGPSYRADPKSPNVH